MTSQFPQVCFGKHFESVVEHASDAYLLNGMEEYEDWCQRMLEVIGLDVRERDDFITFWAQRIWEYGPTVIVRVVPESDVEKSCGLSVKAQSCEEQKEVPVQIKRVYVTMVVGKDVPPELSGKMDQIHVWEKEKGSAITLPKELRSSFPIVRDPEAFTVIEWGGVFITV